MDNIYPNFYWWPNHIEGSLKWWKVDEDSYHLSYSERDTKN